MKTDNVIGNEKMQIKHIEDNAEIRIYYNPEAITHTEIINKIDNYDSLLNETEKLKKLLEGLTPGGSEFYNDPEYCAKWVREQIQGLPKAILPFKQKSEKLKSVNDSLLSALKGFVDRIDNSPSPAAQHHYKELLEAGKEAIKQAEGTINHYSKS